MLAYEICVVTLVLILQDIQTFMDDAEDGVIYFSLGSNVKTGQGFDAEELILIESFRRMKQRILWKWENENLKVDLKNVKISKWFPQVEILGEFFIQI